MTNAEAIKMLKSKMDGHTDTSYEWAETVRMAIKALEQQTCEDAVSRQAVLDAMYALCDTGGTLKENPWRDNPHIDAVTETIEQLPSVNPQPICEEREKGECPYYAG